MNMQNQIPKKLNNFMFDTNIFDRVLDVKLDITDLKKKGKFFVTHIQLDELNAISDPIRKAELLEVFGHIVTDKVSTESAVWDISKWDESKWSSEKPLTPTETFVLGVSRLGQAKLSQADIYSIIKNELDKIKNKPNNPKDALIAETSIKNGFILVTDDQTLHRVVTKIGGQVLSFLDFKKV